jgi:hypothetical protein
MEINPKYGGRIRAAFWSKTLLGVAAVLSVLILPFDFDWESALIVAGVLTVTFFEFRVHSYFLNGDPRAPDLGFRNQSCFAAAILLYGLYHAVYPTPIPPEYRSLFDDTTLELIQSTVRNGYLAIGILGGISQFALAWYYRGAKTPPPLGGDA